MKEKIPASLKELLKEFLIFLKEYNVIALAIAFIMGTASTGLVNSLVKDVIMPVLSPLLSTDSWNEMTFDFGPIHIKYGSFLAELFNFLILALIIFLIAKKLFNLESQKNK